ASHPSRPRCRPARERAGSLAAALRRHVSVLPKPLPDAAEAARVHRFPESAPRVISRPSTPRLRRRARANALQTDALAAIAYYWQLVSRFRLNRSPHQEEEVPDAQIHDSFHVAGCHAHLLLPRLRRVAAGRECSCNHTACAAAAAESVRPARTDGLAAIQRAPIDAAELPAGAPRDAGAGAETHG